MTIIQPNKQKKGLKIFIIPALAVILSWAVLSIFLYSAVVNLRFEITKAEKGLKDLRVSNAEFKNQLYGLLDAEILRAAAKEAGMVLDKKPVYINTVARDLAQNL